MSIHSGFGTLSSRSNTVEITTTLFELMEAMVEQTDSEDTAGLHGQGRSQTDLDQDRQIARTIANMFLSGKIRFKHPRNIEQNFPELFD
ncbi:MAG: hypothetical protein ACOX3E_02360 [Desulfomonilia bacterium]|jgi:hypothetical protein|uniref:Uncharacterized protein n=1 Tax=anaerobic digester metagenome TaxID=1263854 RepID=A0A485M068_9ZZZZ|nr:hypothetical protein [Pseudomonadota bacterium]HON37401.1 hypothetical protein [Deltaproteobacteria bacterium]HRS55500.1 hypothetical protein [Desulfomonilia bacterium]HPD20578.1 hypothetical protein [Deltaproteobacteria bacterium]HPX17308.1 hypothetical protein [Deltaproteobacteria bacterium]